MASPTQAGIFTVEADSSQLSLTGFVGFLVCAGLTNSLIAAFLLCRLPESHHPSVAALFVRAFLYVGLAALAGIAGARIYWSRSASPFKTNPPLPFALFALTCAAGWVWVPSVVLLSSQDSPSSPAIAVLGAAILATALRKVIPAAYHAQWPSLIEERELFAQSLWTPTRESHGYVIAVCIFASAYALNNRFILTAAALLALCAFLFTWKLTLAPALIAESKALNSRAALRLARIAIAAILVTLIALLFGVAGRNRLAANSALAGDSGAASGGESNQKPQSQNAALGFSGYESIILWPIPQKKQIIPPLPAPTSLLAPGTTKPLVIRFDGPYWYFQPPGKHPGPHAHQAQGTPLAVKIETTNSIPLSMEAHQNLGSSVRLARCREIQVAIENDDNRPGEIAVGVLLTDSSSPGKPTLYLGEQPILTTEPGHFSVKSSPANEVLRFATPEHGKIRKFDEITVLFLPDVEHFEVGSRIAIREFQLLPR